MVQAVETGVDEWSWSVEVAYACACGAYSPLTRWRWVDADANPELVKKLRETGPIEGNCRTCQRPAEGGGAWLELQPAQEQATLVLAAHQRGDLLEVLGAHLEQLRERPAQVRHWLLQPRITFAAARPAATTQPEAHERGAGIPRPVGQRGWASGPVLSAEIQRALVCDLVLEDSGVAVVAVLDESTRRMWGSAALQARPVLLRGLGYPLLGVRLVASYLGEVAVIDAVVDVGEATTSEIFVRLAQSFRLQLLVRSDVGQASAVREIEAEALRRNAAMCLESAQAQLGAGEFPSDAYRTARDSLARMSAKQRLEPARSTLAEGSYRHLVSPSEGLAALERLDQASRKDNLARLLEVDGLPVGEYEAMRKAVLAAALEFGLVAPARFWRRVLGTDLVRDAGEWISKLVAHRSAWITRGDDLTPEQAEQAWRGIFDLCQHHNLTPPHEVVQALGLAGRRGESPRAGLHVVPVEAPRPAASGRIAEAPRPPSSPSKVAEPQARPSDLPRVDPMRDPSRGDALRGDPPRDPSPRGDALRGDPMRDASRGDALRGDPMRDASRGDALRGDPLRDPSRGDSLRADPSRGEPARPAELPRPSAGLPPPRRSSQPAVAVSGEIGGGLAGGPRPSATARTSDRPDSRPETRAGVGGGDPKQRVAQAMTVLAGKRPADALPLLAELEEDELLALLPPLAEVGTRLVPELLDRLSAPRRPLRQAAAIVLGLARDRRAIDPLTAMLGAETSAVWIDVAKALGNFGPRVVGPLCALLRGAPAETREALALRVARTFAELVVSDGDAPGGAGRLAVENLLEVADPTVSSAARRALATLADVRGEARGAGGGAEDREILRFSARAYEAITTPELDADGAIEVVGED